jgi:predicted PurR-regulated permease PerM
MLCLLLFWRVVQDYVNSPRIMGASLEIQPLIVVIAIMVGGQAGGIAGAYLAVPTAAALRIAWSELRNRATIQQDTVLTADSRRVYDEGSTS